MATIKGFAGGAFIQINTGAAGSPPVITTTSLPDAVNGVAYDQQLSATGDAPITYSVLSGALPTGLSMDSSGHITGTPTADGTFNFTVRATNATGTDDQPLSILVYTAGAEVGYNKWRLGWRHWSHI